MSEEMLTAGDEVDSYCTSCRLMLAHQIVALVAGKPEKVVCKTCGKEHKYRAKPPKSDRTVTVTSIDAPKKDEPPKKEKEVAAKKEPAAKKDETPKKKAAAKPKTTKISRKARETEADWEGALAGRDIAQAKAYAISEQFQERDVLNHKTFGYGVVVKLMPEGKMQVRFKDGTKLLVFGKK